MKSLDKCHDELKEKVEDGIFEEILSSVLS